MTAEVPLIAVAIFLVLVATILALPRRRVPWRARAALAVGAVGAFVPLLAFPFRDPARSSGTALWEWSAAGGPTVHASYRFDGLAAVVMFATIGYTIAGLLGVQRASRRHQLLPALVLATGFVSIALAVTDDLIAASVALGVLAALTAFAELIVAPATASARLAAFFAIGVQSFVVAALLVARYGEGAFTFDTIRPTSVSPGVILAGALGAALFAGLYPFIPWRYEGETARTPEREPLRGLLAMPAGVGATAVFIRLLGSTRGEISTFALPAAHPAASIGAVVLVLALVIPLALRRRPVPLRPLAVGALLLVLIALYPSLNFSHIVLVAALLSVAYAAAVTLAMPEQWEVVRYDVALAAVWVGLAVGTPTALAGALFLLIADATAAMLGAIWLPPHRWYIASVTAATASIGAMLAIGAGIRGAPDLPTQALAVAALAALLLLVLVNLGRELTEAFVPTELDVTGGAVAFLGSLLLALVSAPALEHALASTLARPIGPAGPSAPFAVPALVVTATLLVVVARTVRPLLPDLGAVAGGLRTIVAAVDPVPAVIALFRILEGGTGRASAVFGAFEERAGVWLATLLIVGLLVWATRI
ncbi:MAG TPA: hypothetical protein VFM93_13305 [Candidatus Limnocylindria bacterium]|nr:hypothetical protein [Candidatus Limnocylindria bacterium]